MKTSKAFKAFLLLEQLENRIFLDANPLVAVDTVDPVEQPVDQPLPASENPIETTTVEQNLQADTTGDISSPDISAPSTAAEAPPLSAPDTQPPVSADQSPPEQPQPAEQVQNTEGAEQTEESRLTEPQKTEVDYPDMQEPDISLESAAETAQQALDEDAPADDMVTESDELFAASEELPPGANPPIELIDPMIGEDFTFTYSFDNILGQTGYGPYVDIYFPTYGLQGDHPGGIGDGYDGIQFVSASYLGTPVTAVEQTFDAGGQLDHPFARDSNGDPVVITGQAGDTYVTLRLPFGSYTPQQPASDIVITAHMSNLAEVDVPLDITTGSGFIFGLDPLDNPTTDPSLPNQPDQTTAWLPEVIRFHKDYVGPEGETATGPNYARTYSITVDVADGQTVDNLQITENLPDNIYYLGDGTVTGGTVLSSPGQGIWSGQQLIIDLGTVTGGPGSDATVTFGYYVPEVDSGGTPILTACQTTTPIINDMQLEADWTPLDDRDAPGHIIVDAEVDGDGNISPTPDVDEIFEAQPIVIQKSPVDVNGGDYVPGDLIEFTLQFQISDYYALGNIEIQDIMPDGMAFLTDAAHLPSFTIQDQYGTATDSFTVGAAGSGAEVEFSTTGGDDTQIYFHVSEAFFNRGDADGILEGGRTNNTIGGAALGTITYYGRIQDYYTSPNVPVDQGDILSNNVEISADRYDYDINGLLNPLPTCTLTNADNSSADIELPVGGVSKDLYAINGVPVGAGPVHVSPGDAVTYRLTYALPTSDYQELVLSDYLPLPVFDADDPDQNGGPDVWATYFTEQAITDAIGGAVPMVGQAMFGPGETFYTYSGGDTGGHAPTVTTNGGQNALLFNWSAHYNASHQSTTVDLLFTVEASTEPFADGLLLTNQVQAREDGNVTSTTSTAIVQIVLDEPELEVGKGVIDTDNTGGAFTDPTGPVRFSAAGTANFRGLADITESGLDTTAIDADLAGIDAGDLVSFAITVRNVGHYEAHEIRIDDDLPTGFAIPAIAQSARELNLSVTDGHGNVLAFTDGLGNSYGSAGFNFFTNGLVLTPPLAGNDDATDQTDNILLVTYDLISGDVVQPLQEMINTGELTSYSSAPGGTNFIPEGLTDEASVTTVAPAMDKDFNPIYAGNTSYTDQPHTTDPDVAVGELVSYQAVITVPEGSTHTVTLSDTMDAGFAIVDIDQVTASAGLSTSIAGGWSQILTDARAGLSVPGQTFTIDFGTITNSDRDNAVDETITVTYRVVALNTAANQEGVHLNNNARWHWVEDSTGTSTPHTISDRAPDVIVREPDMSVEKLVQDSDGSWVDTATGLDQGDTVSYRITVRHDATTINGFDAYVEDVLPNDIDWTGVTAADWTITGTTPDSWSYDAVTHTLVADWNELGSGNSTIFEVSGGLLDATLGGQSITNTGNLTWTSLPGDVTAPQSPYNTVSTERTGDSTDPGTTANDYRNSDNAVITMTGSIDKVNNGIYTIGETHTYDIQVSLPEGVTTALNVIDNLPDGLIYVGTSYDFVDFENGGSSVTSKPSDPIIAGNTLTYDFGDTDVFADNDPTNNGFTIHLTVLVANVSANVDGTSLTNHVSMQYDNGSVTIDDPTDPVVNVVEPWITTDKTVVDASGDQTVGALGELLTYTVRFTNNGNSTAFEVDALDTMAPGTNFVSLDSVTYHDTSAASDLDITGLSFSTDNADGTISFGSTDTDSWDIATNDYVEIVYTAQVLGAWFVPGTHINTIDADWSGLDGNNPEERIYDDGLTPPGSPVDGTQDIDTAQYIVLQGEGEIGDTVWFDADNSGGPVPDPGETGIAGVSLSLDVVYMGNHYYASDITDANGQYLFSHLQAATYTVILDPTTLPAGMTQTYGLDLPTGNQGTHVLATDEVYLEMDFSYTGLGSIGDYVWYDSNQDGVQDTGEPPLAGVNLNLEGDLDGDGVFEFTTTATTDGSGNYQFSNLPFVEYHITVDQTSLPSGLTTPTWDRDGVPDHTTGVTLTVATQDVDNADFGYTGSGRIGDLIWDDLNGDGTADPGEPGLVNIALTLQGDLDGNGSTDFTLQTVTDSSGNYLFDLLPEADYTVLIDSTSLPASYIQSGDPDGILDNRSQLTLTAANPVNLNQDFGYTLTGSIGDTLWYDGNDNASQDSGEPGLSGVTVTLVGDVDLDGTPDTLTAVTDGSGQYLFDTLPIGNYTITIDPATLPAGLRPTYDADGIGTPDTTDVVLGYGENNPDIDFGYTGTGSLGDFIWYDANGDSVQDPSEPGFPGVGLTLELDLNGDGNTDYTTTTTTDPTGAYLFDNLMAGTYTITVDTATLPGGVQPTWDLDGISTPHTTQVILAGSQNRTDVDFGYTGTGSIGDTVWYDANGDSAQDPGEPGFLGVGLTLEIDLNGDGLVDYTATTTTDQNGSYLFSNLVAGTYTITVDPATLAGGIQPTHDLDGITTPDTTEVLLAGSQDRSDADFGYTGTGSIGDTIWYDYNRDGIQGIGEPGLANINMTLTGDFDGNGSVDYTATMQTNTNGLYLFDHLPTGSYTVTVDPTTLPSGASQVYDPDGTLDHRTDLDLSAGEDNLDQDFGYVPPPVPPKPPVVPTPPVGPPVPGDVLLMYQFNRSGIDNDDVFLFPEPEEIFMPPPIEVSPLYTGRAEPGTTLTLTLFDALGNSVGYQTVMADTGGNWLAGFQGTLLYDMPHHMEITQTGSLYNNSTPGLFNLRSYFNPTMTGLVFSSIRLDISSITAYEAATVAQSLHNENSSLLNLGWDDFSGYEFFSPSINPAQHKR